MEDMLPRSVSRPLKTPVGEAIGISNRWNKGQYCALFTKAGIVGCGIYDISVAEEFDFAIAIAKGTPAQPLVEPEDLYNAKIVRATRQAKALGIAEGMTGLEALKILVDKSATL